MARRMNFDFGLEAGKFCKRKNRFLLKIPEVCADGINSLPPLGSARPNVSFTEMEIRHVVEDITYPAKPNWDPLNLTLYDTSSGGDHPIYEWLKTLYDPEEGLFNYVVDSGVLKTATLEMYDGCGTLIETWIYEEVWPKSINFGDLHMSEASVVTCDLTLEYVRAHIKR